jgi:hypothetical protein
MPSSSTAALSREQHCSVCNDHCELPANLEFDPEEDVLATSCFACGDSVCTSLCCSVERDYLRYGVQRICADCELAHFPDAELLQRQRAYQAAGYPNYVQLGCADHAETLLRHARRSVEQIYRIDQVRVRRGKRSSFRAFSASHS